jgi:hypothetical protein
MAYIQYFDDRYGDLYEVYTDDVTGEFEAALRSVGGEVNGEKIHYMNLSDIPPYPQNQIEHIIWKRQHPQSSSQKS